MTKTRTITLTGRRPVQITEAAWPIIASADGDSYHGSDYARHNQALSQGECDTYTLIVRRHDDGRHLVYGITAAAITAWHQPAGGVTRRAGYLLEPGSDHESTISLVATECEMPSELAADCLADLPAEVV